MHEHSILVVEDEQTLRRLLEYRLSKQFRVRTAGHGAEALERISDEIPDLVVSDIMMPGMDGFALQEALQNDERTRAIPFIFLTAKADDHSRERGLRIGVDDYITKPFNMDQLLVRIDHLLQRTKLYQNKLNARIGQDFSQRLMPKKLPDAPGYQIHFCAIPREEGGGDLFDWIEIQPGSYLITIGDVMGKGLQAKFYAFSFLSYIRGTIHALRHETSSPAQLLTRVNQLLMQDAVLEDTFASLLLILWEPCEHRVVYANAGHCRPLMVSQGASSVVEHSDLILGLDAEAPYRDSTVDLKPGNAFVAFTDGVLEQQLEDGDQVGEAGAIKSASSVLGAEEPALAFLEEILTQSESPHFTDDILVFWLQRDA